MAHSSALKRTTKRVSVPIFESTSTTIDTYDVNADIFSSTDVSSSLQSPKLMPLTPPQVIRETIGIMELFDSPDYLETIRKASGSSDDEVDMKHLVSLHAQSKSLSNHPIMLLPSACLSDVSQTNTITSPSSKYKRSKSRKKKSKKRQNGSKRHRRKQYDRRFTDTELYGGPFPFFVKRSPTYSHSHVQRKHQKRPVKANTNIETDMLVVNCMTNNCV
eukprot:466840_1